MLNKPADIGFDMMGYDLPTLNLIERQIVTPKRDNGSLFNDAIISATNFNAELRLTKKERLDEVVRIVNSRPDENFIIWIKQNDINVPISNTAVTTLGGSNAKTVASWNWFVNAAAGDYVQLIWASDAADARIQYNASPTYGPAIPSLIVTVDRVG